MASDFQAEWNKARSSPQGREDFLRLQIARTNLDLERMGKAGQTLLKAFQATNVTEKTQDLDKLPSGALANYVSFDLERGFINEIRYFNSSFSSYYDFFKHRIHENFHAVQYNRIAACHARVLNPHTQVVLCPRDDFWLRGLCERTTYTVEDYMGASLTKIDPAIFLKSDKTDLDIILYHHREDIKKSWRQIAVSREDFYRKNYYDKKTFENLSLHAFLKKKFGSPVACVRLGIDDLIQLGDTLIGPNLFEPDDFSKTGIFAPPELSWEDRMYLWLNLRGWRHDKVPEFRQKLAELRITPQEFLDKSKNSQADHLGPNLQQNPIPVSSPS